MYSTIMIPIDLENMDKMHKPLTVGSDLAKLYKAETHLVSVTQSSPTSVARTPEEFKQKLSDYADKCSEQYGVPFLSHSEVSNDITRDLDGVLKKVADGIDADLIVMASHIPGYSEYVFASNAGYLASHSRLSVLVVR